MQSSALVKAHILSKGVRVDYDILRNFSNYKKESFVYNDSRWATPSLRQLTPQELMLTNLDGSHSTVVSCITYPNSPLILTADSSMHLKLVDTSEGDTELPVRISLLREPLFWSRDTTDGFPMGRIVSTCGLCEANVWLWHDCALPYEGVGCAFCGINSVAKNRLSRDLLMVRDFMQVSDPEALWLNKKELVLRNVVETVVYALNHDYEDHCHLIYINGNMPNELLDLQWQIYCDIADVVNVHVQDLPTVDISAVLMPPNDFTLIDRAKLTGIEHVALNLEVWDTQLFRALCPGKAMYGRDKMLEALEHAVDVFGAGRAWSNFVLGLEPHESTLAGIQKLAEMGVVGGANVFHRDFGARLKKLKPPKPPGILEFYQALAQLYHDRGFKPFFCEKALRTSLTAEAYLGWLS